MTISGRPDVRQLRPSLPRTVPRSLGPRNYQLFSPIRLSLWPSRPPYRLIWVLALALALVATVTFASPAGEEDIFSFSFLSGPRACGPLPVFPDTPDFSRETGCRPATRRGRWPNRPSRRSVVRWGWISAGRQAASAGGAGAVSARLPERLVSRSRSRADWTGLDGIGAQTQWPVAALGGVVTYHPHRPEPRYSTPVGTPSSARGWCETP